MMGKRDCTELPKIFGVGLGRTGTTSLHIALDVLGVTPVHDWCTLLEDVNGVNALWAEQLDVVQRTLSTTLCDSKKRPTRRMYQSAEDWDSIFEGYAASVDAPTNLFVAALVNAYPNAKFILTVRDTPQAWVKSWENTIWAEYNIRHSSMSYRVMNFLDRIVGRESTYLQVLRKLESVRAVIWQHGNEPMASSYLQHNEYVRRLIPKDRLLEFNVKEGWRPLCNFLEKEVPSQPFPRVNDRQSWWREVDDEIVRQKRRFRSVVVVCIGAVVLGVTLLSPSKV